MKIYGLICQIIYLPTNLSLPSGTFHKSWDIMDIPILILHVSWMEMDVRKLGSLDYGLLLYTRPWLSIFTFNSSCNLQCFRQYCVIVIFIFLCSATLYQVTVAPESQRLFPLKSCLKSPEILPIKLEFMLRSAFSKFLNNSPDWSVFNLS